MSFGLQQAYENRFQQVKIAGLKSGSNSSNIKYQRIDALSKTFEYGTKFNIQKDDSRQMMPSIQRTFHDNLVDKLRKTTFAFNNVNPMSKHLQANLNKRITAEKEEVTIPTTSRKTLSIEDHMTIRNPERIFNRDITFSSHESSQGSSKMNIQQDFISGDEMVNKLKKIDKQLKNKKIKTPQTYQNMNAESQTSPTWKDPDNKDLEIFTPRSLLSPESIKETPGVINNEPTQYQCIPIKVWDCHQIINSTLQPKSYQTQIIKQNSHSSSKSGKKINIDDIISDTADLSRNVIVAANDSPLPTFQQDREVNNVSVVTHQQNDLKLETPIKVIKRDHLTTPIVTVKHSGLASAKIVNFDSGELPEDTPQKPPFGGRKTSNHQLYCKPMIEEQNISQGLQIMTQQIFERPQRNQKTLTPPKKKIRIRPQAVNLRTNLDFKVVGQKALASKKVMRTLTINPLKYTRTNMQLSSQQISQHQENLSENCEISPEQFKSGMFNKTSSQFLASGIVTQTSNKIMEIQQVTIKEKTNDHGESQMFSITQPNFAKTFQGFRVEGSRCILEQSPRVFHNSKRSSQQKEKVIKVINAFEQKLTQRIYKRHVSVNPKKLNRDLIEVQNKTPPVIRKRVDIQNPPPSVSLDPVVGTNFSNFVKQLLVPANKIPRRSSILNKYSPNSTSNDIKIK